MLKVKALELGEESGGGRSNFKINIANAMQKSVISMFCRAY